MIVAVVLATIVAAIAWISVTFTDRSFACGTALGEARHGEIVPAVFLAPVPPSPGLHSFTVGPGGDTQFATVCRGQARARLAESAAAMLVALVGVALVLRRRHQQPPDPAMT
jgi:hypothetical protein